MALTWLYLFGCIFSHSSTVGASTPESQDKRIHVMTSVNKLAGNRAACSLNYRKVMTIGKHVFRLRRSGRVQTRPVRTGPIRTGLDRTGSRPDPDLVWTSSEHFTNIFRTFSGKKKGKNENSNYGNNGNSGGLAGDASIQQMDGAVSNIRIQKATETQTFATNSLGFRIHDKKVCISAVPLKHRVFIEKTTLVHKLFL
jgi:hypothetical protein